MKNISLKQEAEKIVQDLELIPMLAQYGKAEVVGSIALDLVVKRDIDIHILLDSEDFLRVANEITGELLQKPSIDEVRISDWREIESMKVSVDDFEGPSGPWDIEIWLTRNTKNTAFDLVKKFKKELTDEKRKAIMHLKQYFYDRDLLRNGMSMKIYTAVMDHHIKTVEAFEDYLKKEKHEI